ncbi:aluminum-activated malate transporter 2-like [Prosopis cineraria]|uniref:aluminum-activated malate transporter 2-like n=1 Tax=Prosopis cineraria TaxID=364024 RepID=UPI002410798B|nr:aluminum-activated malate transporter 2-like [Prosopis cineraria]
MQMSSSNQHTSSGLMSRGWVKLKAMPKGLKEKVFHFYGTAKEIQQDDPRRVIHAFKVGLTLTLVSLFYYYQPLYDSFGLSAMWAVMIVVVVFEYYVGATLGKGLNRGLATLLAGALGVGAHYLTDLSGQTIEPILISFFVFLLATIATFIRFFPKIKARYDYGLLIFILTFSLISVSGFREDEIIEMAHKRFTTILIGGSACVMMSIFVCPVWAGEELHSLISLNLESLANFLQAFEDEYFKISKEGESKDDKTSLLEGYKIVLNSESSEESLANFARWEPGHGRFQFRHPWDKYLKIGTLTRQCAYRMEALNSQLSSNLQASAEIKSIIQEACSEMCLESRKALKELGMAMSIMRKSCLADTHIANSKSAAKSLNSLLQSNWWKEIDLLSILPAGIMASLLCDIVACIEEIAAAVNELPSFTYFETAETTKSPSETSSTPHSYRNSHVVIPIGDSTLSDLPESKSLSDQHNTHQAA